MLSPLRRLHLIVGLTLFVGFTVTGRYMRIDFPDKDAIPPELRMLMRSRHIYILFCSLVHLVLGTYFRDGSDAWQRWLQYLGSAVLTLAGIILLWAFVAESYQVHSFTDISRWGIYLSLTGVGLHLIGGIYGQKAEP
jgi:hypothetical protein